MAPISLVNETSPFIAIAGNIGAGKSSLTRLLAERFSMKPYFESVDDNPYLKDFYAEMARWSFHLQIYFLTTRFKHHREIMKSPIAVVQDRTIYEDVEIFAKNLHAIGKMDDRDYRNYRSHFEVMMEFLRPPDLLIYLQASVDTLVKQIARRGRAYEQGIPRDYLEQLNALYEEWIRSYSLGRLLIVRSDNRDFVNVPSDFDNIAEMAGEILTAKQDAHVTM